MPGAMLECAVCTGLKFHELGKPHLDELSSAGAVGLECPNCKRKTYWFYGEHGGVRTPAAISSQPIGTLSSSALGAISSAGAAGAREGPRLYHPERRLSARQDRRNLARRAQRRVALQMPVRLRVSTMNAQFEDVTRTVNTCRTGIYIQSEQPYTKGAPAFVAMNYNPRSTDLASEQRATVVRVDSMPGARMRGVAFQFQ